MAKQPMNTDELYQHLIQTKNFNDSPLLKPIIQRYITDYNYMNVFHPYKHHFISRYDYDLNTNRTFHFYNNNNSLFKLSQLFQDELKHTLTVYKALKVYESRLSTKLNQVLIFEKDEIEDFLLSSIDNLIGELILIDHQNVTVLQTLVSPLNDLESLKVKNERSLFQWSLKLSDYHIELKKLATNSAMHIYSNISEDNNNLLKAMSMLKCFFKNSNDLSKIGFAFFNENSNSSWLTIDTKQRIVSILNDNHKSDIFNSIGIDINNVRTRQNSHFTRYDIVFKQIRDLRNMVMHFSSITYLNYEQFLIFNSRVIKTTNPNAILGNIKGYRYENNNSIHLALNILINVTSDKKLVAAQLYWESNFVNSQKKLTSLFNRIQHENKHIKNDERLANHYKQILKNTP